MVSKTGEYQQRSAKELFSFSFMPFKTTSEDNSKRISGFGLVFKVLFFFMGTILKVFIELVTIFLLLFVLCLVTLLCPTLRPRELSLPGSSVHGIPQARIHCSGLPCAPPGDLPNPGIKPRAPPLQADSLPPPWILQGEGYSFSRGPSQPRNQIGVSCTVRGFFIRILLFMFWIFWPQGMWDLRYPTKD